MNKIYLLPEEIGIKNELGTNFISSKLIKEYVNYYFLDNNVKLINKFFMLLMLPYVCWSIRKYEILRYK